MGTFKLVKLIGQGLNNTIITGGLVPKGAYDNGTDYAVGDSVSYTDGNSYVMHTNADAGTLPTDTTKWQVLANKGDTGAAGATGDAGAAGANGADGEGVIAGGTTGQVLVKASNDDYDTEWSSAGSGDMAAAVYDPQNVEGDAFDTDNHTDGTTNKVFTATEKTKLSGIETSADVTDATNVNAAGAVMESDYDAHTILRATSDNTPTALTVGEQTVVGRATGGNIAALVIDSDLASVSGSDDTIPSAKATKAALDLKAPLASPTFTGTVTAENIESDYIHSDEFNMLDSNWYLKYITPGDHIRLAGSGNPGGRFFQVWDSDDSAARFEVEIDTGNSTVHGNLDVDDVLSIGGDDITASPAELNILDGATLDVTELNYVNGVTSAIQTQLDGKVDDATLASHESDTTTHGTTGDIVGTSDTQTLTNKTLTSPKINENVAITATATELNYTDGVTSAIQTQLDAKLALAGGTMSGNILLGESASIQLDSALSADGKWTGIVRAGTAGATLAFGDLVYLAAADSRWELADADAASTSGDVILGICVLAAASDGDATTILLYGNVRADTAFPDLTIGAPAYVGTTAGDIQVAQPSGTDDVIRRVGFALTADELMFNPSNDYVTHT